MKEKIFILSTEQDTFELAEKITKVLVKKTVIYLYGALGVGKTTFVRSFLRSLHYIGPVRSPTYTLVEIYSQLKIPIYHFDLYRMSTPEELEYIGIRDFMSQEGIYFFEWPEKGCGYLPKADLIFNFEYIPDKSNNVQKRKLVIKYDENKVSL